MLSTLAIVEKRHDINGANLRARIEYVPTTWAPREDRRKWILKPMGATRSHFLRKKVAPSHMKTIPCALIKCIHNSICLSC